MGDDASCPQAFEHPMDMEEVCSSSTFSSPKVMLMCTDLTHLTSPAWLS